MFKFVRGFIVGVFIIIIAAFVVKGILVYNAVKSGKVIYQVDVNSFNGGESYLTKEYTKDEKTGCITFKDEIGIKRVVCNNYTISEY